ncbi:hypothetical protein CMI48_04285 [Candidatus Pacearchaeota archaeon]|nr:hypothetical protein [Candidatus Pacearchaeota archaeon]|tara:strand:- start:562 stop:834 length:273 start_codon:yes stop_codon:yes gene_type:complete
MREASQAKPRKLAAIVDQTKRRKSKKMTPKNTILKPLILLLGLAIGITITLHLFIITPSKLLGLIINPGTLVILLTITIILFWAKTNPRT